VQYKVNPAAETPREVLLSSTISDVRCQGGTDASVCSSANAVAGPDYSGELQINSSIRISDHYNGPGLNEPATVVELPNPVEAICASTSDTAFGGLCTISTSLTALVPTPEFGGQRSVVEFGQIEVSDGGEDGDVETVDNTPFMRQGVFIP
jgi:hypothetical protein